MMLAFAEIPKPSTIMVYWSSLLLLLQSCVTCSANATIEKLTLRGSATSLTLNVLEGTLI